MRTVLRELSPCVVFLCGAAVCSDVRAGTLSLGIGADYASGKYGEPTKTTDLYIPFSMGYQEGAWKAKLVIPFLSIRGNGEVVGVPPNQIVDDRRGRGGSQQSASEEENEDRASGSSSAAAAATSTSNSGLGDVVASATYTAISNEAKGFFVDITGRIKFGTASHTKDLGTGENDYSLLIHADQDLGRFTFSLGAGYTWIGSPSGFDYRNVWSATTGVSYRISDLLSVNTDFFYRQAVRQGSPDQLAVEPGITLRFDSRHKVNAYLLFGLDDGSPDYGAGIAYTHTFD